MKLVTDDGHEIPIESIKVVDIPKDAVIVINTEWEMSNFEMEVASKQMNKLFPYNHTLFTSKTNISLMKGHSI